MPDNFTDGLDPVTIQNLNWVKGDAMNPETFKDILKESNGLIHAVGTLVDTSIT
jgi:hypothetical protein